MSDVYIVRHGNTFDKGDIVTRVGGRTDLPLSQSGLVQARALGQHFEAQNLTFAHAACSTLQRTQQTLGSILNLTQSSAKPQTLPFLTELDYGPDENQPEAAVIARIGEEALRQWDEAAILPAGWQLDIPALIQDWGGFFAIAQTRPAPSIIVTSNGIARFLFAALSLSAAGQDIKLKTGAYGHVRFKDNKWTLLGWNIRPQNAP